MHDRRPPRLPTFDYIGEHPYFVTWCTHERRRLFGGETLVSALVWHILQAAAMYQFAVLAYVFMPDHLHLLVEGRHPDADFRKFMLAARRRTSSEFCRHGTGVLWQDGYFERVLRRGEDRSSVIAYILNNPVRAGLVQQAVDYPFGWSIESDPGADL